jgi:hypothetical protein
MRRTLTALAAAAALAIGAASGAAADAVTVGVANARSEPEGTSAVVTAMVTTSPAAPGESYSAELIDPNGKVDLTHGTLDGQGGDSIRFVISKKEHKSGTYKIRISLIRNGQLVTGAGEVLVSFNGPAVWVLIDGPAAGTFVKTESGTDLKVDTDDPLMKYSGAAGTVSGPTGKCKQRHFSGKPYGKADEKKSGCGWGHVAPAGDATEQLSLLAGSITAEEVALESLLRNPPYSGLALRELGGAHDALTKLRSTIDDLVKAGKLVKSKTYPAKGAIDDALKLDRDVFEHVRKLTRHTGNGNDEEAAVKALEKALGFKREALSELRKLGLLLRTVEAPALPDPHTGSFRNTKTHNYVCVYLTGAPSQKVSVTLTGQGIKSQNPQSGALDMDGRGMVWWTIDGAGHYTFSVERQLADGSREAGESGSVDVPFDSSSAGPQPANWGKTPPPCPPG